MSGRLPWFPLFPKDYLADTHVAGISLEAQGAYVRLLCHVWLERRVDAELAILARLVGLPLAEFRDRIWPAIRDRFQVDADGRLVSPRLERERSRAQARAHKGYTAAAARWGGR